MNKFNKTFAISALAVCLCACLAAPASAQTAGPLGGGTRLQGQERGERGAQRANISKRIHAILSQLNLTADQKKDIKDLSEKFRADMKALRQANKGGDKEELRDKVQKLTKSYIKSIEGVMTPDQVAKFKEELKETAKHRKGKGKDKDDDGDEKP